MPGNHSGYKFLRPITMLADLMMETDRVILSHCKRLNIKTKLNKFNEKCILAKEYLRVKRSILKEQYYDDRKARGI